MLIMTSPPAALSGNEVTRLFNVVKALREQGCAVLFISHRLDEIFELLPAGHHAARRRLDRR
ncbi:hypothetical protein GCM10018952_63270 [Streptosporangium vulgare]